MAGLQKQLLRHLWYYYFFKCWISAGHGPVWKKYARLVHRVFPELPIVTRCHNYEITYKFYYNCCRCSFSTGRHSKSIDTTTHVCPYCRGALQLSSGKYYNFSNKIIYNTEESQWTPKTFPKILSSKKSSPILERYFKNIFFKWPSECQEIWRISEIPRVSELTPKIQKNPLTPPKDSKNLTFLSRRIVNSDWIFHFSLYRSEDERKRAESFGGNTENSTDPKRVCFIRES